MKTKITNKIVLIILTLTIIMFTLIGCVDNQGTTSKYTDGLAFELNNDSTYSVIGYKNATDNKVIIPESHQNAPVTGIKKLQNSNITEVVLPNTIKFISENAFKNNSNMNVINIPDNVESIGKDAFLNTALYNNCNEDFLYIGKWLIANKNHTYSEQVTIKEDTIGIADSFSENKDCGEVIIFPNALQYVGTKAFSGNRLRLVWLPAGVKYGEYAFFTQESINYSKPILYFITQDGNVTTLNGVFNKNYTIQGWGYNREDIIIQNNIVYLVNTSNIDTTNNFAEIACGLDNAKSQVNIDLADTITLNSKEYKVKKIWYYAFDNFSNLNTIKLPKYLKTIHTYAFRKTGLISVEIPRGTETIQKHAFKDCDSIMSFYLPNTVMNIDNFGIIINAKGCVYTDHQYKPAGFDEGWAQALYFAIGMNDAKVEWNYTLAY